MATRRIAALGAAIVLGVAPLLVLPAKGQTAAVPATAFANGTILHADALDTGDMRLADVEVAFAGSALDGDGFAGALTNELGRQFVSDADGKTTFGRGTALEIGLGITPTDENQLILAGKAERSAPPRLEALTEQVGPIDLAPLAWAGLLRGVAGANTSQTPCALGVNASDALGHVADVELLDTASEPGEGEGLSEPLVALDSTDPDSAISESHSSTQYVSQRDRDGKLIGSKFGVVSEVRQTIAPITLFRGTENQVTIHLLGEWVLQAVAMGLPGNAFVHYGPDAADDETPVVRIVRADGAENILKLQDVFGPEGFVLELPGVAEIAIGEPARAIDGAAGSAPLSSPDGTKAAGAVDVVRVRALPGAPAEIADLRLGHMEAQAQVPAGGADCGIPVSKSPSLDTVDVGQAFDVAFDITNPYDCTLTGVNLEDAIITEDGARFEVVATDPPASEGLTGSLSSGELGWADLGDIKPGETKRVNATMVARGGAGRILDTASAEASLKDCAQEGATVAGVDISVIGAGLRGVSAQLDRPVVETGVLAQFGGPSLPRTGVPVLVTVLSGLALFGVGAGGLAALRRFR